MRPRCEARLPTVIIIIVILTLVYVTPLTSSAAGARSSSRQRNNQQKPAYYGYGGTYNNRDRQRYWETNNDVTQPDDDYNYDGEGSCDIEVACRTETDKNVPPTSMKLPIRGPRGPPAG